MLTLDLLIESLSQLGHSQYGGEAVTQLEHALQTALLAEQHNASTTLISAALLHDFGHLCHDLPNNAPLQGVDDCHEDLGHHYLKSLFPIEVIEPIRLHVAAKRYLCAVSNSYRDQLSEPSRLSLQLQGGVMSKEEIETFKANPFADSAIQLRQWDDLAKDPTLETPPLKHFLPYLQQSLER
jgi:phosphonate degradation associated HDIG domain protein